MDKVEQEQGERRVRMALIEPLKRRGLAKPGTLNAAAFEAMCSELCQRLAYMSDGSLAALEEQVAGNPGGKDRDRFPIANTILTWAAQIQPPEDDGSPLVRAVFGHQIGRDALAQGWAPELLASVKASRRFPEAPTSIRRQADDNIRTLTLMEERLARGEHLTPEQEQWRARRLAIMRKCEGFAALGNRQGVA